MGIGPLILWSLKGEGHHNLAKHFRGTGGGGVTCVVGSASWFVGRGSWVVLRGSWVVRRAS